MQLRGGRSRGRLVTEGPGGGTGPRVPKADGVLWLGQPLTSRDQGTRHAPHRTVPPVAIGRGTGRHGPDRGLLCLVVLVVGVAVFTVGLAVRLAGSREGGLLVGAVHDPGTTLPVLTPDQPFAGAAAPGARVGGSTIEDGPGIVHPEAGGGRRRPPSGERLRDPTGRPYGAPLPFDAAIPVLPDLVWVLLVGSDARPGQDPLRARADSIHLLSANPATGQATILGFPRDSWVDIPGHGPGKINTALGLGGPELLARTVNRFTGLPVQFWVVAGFETFSRVVDEVGGIDVHVEVAMDDRDSGAHFLPGYHHFDGGQALAFCRDRHDFADGDLSRSRNQGAVVLAALAKLQAEVGDEAGLRRWLGVAFRHLTLDVKPEEALKLLAVARRTDGRQVTNLVLPGRGGMAGPHSVVFIDGPAAARIADDLRPDAAIGPARPRPTTVTPPTTTAAPVPPPEAPSADTG